MKTEVQPFKYKTAYGNPRYLRGRPFLCIELYHRPKGPSKGVGREVLTEKKGWGENPDNWQVFESPSIVTSITDNMMRTAAVIIDIAEDKLVKNRFSDNNEKDVLNHYMLKYRKEVQPYVDRYKQFNDMMAMVDQQVENAVNTVEEKLKEESVSE